MACQLKDDSFSLGHLIDGKADENQTIPRERKECRHTELYLAANWEVWSRKADFCVQRMLGTPVKNTAVLARSCWRFVNCSAFSNPTHSAPMVPVVHYYYSKVIFFFYVRYSDTSYGSLIRPERLSDAPTSLTGCCGEDHMPRVIYASVVRNINLALCFITLSAYLTVCDTMKVNLIAAKSAVPLPVYRSTASFSARDQCTS